MLHLRVVKQAQERLLESLILLCLFYLFFSSGLGLHCTLYIQNPAADRHLLVWNPIRAKKALGHLQSRCSSEQVGALRSIPLFSYNLMTYIDEPIEHKGAQSETACCLIPLPAGLVTRRHHGSMPVGGQAGMRPCSTTRHFPTRWFAANQEIMKSLV